MLSPTVVVAPAKPRNPERRAEASTWRLGQDQAELRGGRCYHVNPASQSTDQPSWALWGPALCVTPQRRKQALMQAAPVQAHTESLQDSVLIQEADLNSGLHGETRYLGKKVRKAMNLACLRSCCPVDPCHGLGILPVVL